MALPSALVRQIAATALRHRHETLQPLSRALSTARSRSGSGSSSASSRSSLRFALQLQLAERIRQDGPPSSWRLSPLQRHQWNHTAALATTLPSSAFRGLEILRFDGDDHHDYTYFISHCRNVQHGAVYRDAELAPVAVDVDGDLVATNITENAVCEALEAFFDEEDLERSASG